MKVLIVDHDWRFAQQATNYLESKAHLVVHQTKAKDALATAGHWQPDLVIAAADLAEKGLLEGFAALDTPPAVVLTGRLDQYSRVWRAWQHGGHDILMKPVMKAEELRAAMVTAMENAATGTRGGLIRASA